MAQPYTHHIFSIMAQHRKYGYPRGGFDINISRHQLKQLRHCCFQGKTIRQLFLDDPTALTKKQCVTLGRELSIQSIMSLKNMEYLLCCWGVTEEYLKTITLAHTETPMLYAIAAYTRSSRVFSHASVIPSALAAELKLSDSDFIENRILTSGEIQQLIPLKDGQTRFKYDRTRYIYRTQTFEYREYLFPVRRYDA
jgi:hypothetical protein